MAYGDIQTDYQEWVN